MAIGRIPEPGTGIPESIIAAKGDILTGTANDTPAVLTAGTNETRLVADSGEATGLKYVADTTNYAVAAKGDLLVGTAADTVAPLTVGTDGYTLVADSTETTGLKWAAPAGGGGYTLLSTTSLSTTTTTISGISGSYKDLLIIIQGASWPTFNTTYSLRPNGSTTLSTMSGTKNDANSGAVFVSSNDVINPWYNNMPLNNVNNVAVFQFYNYSNTSYYKAFSAFGYMDNSTGYSFDGGGAFKSNSAITSFNIVLGQAVNFNNGQVLIYGVE